MKDGRNLRILKGKDEGDKERFASMPKEQGIIDRLNDPIATESNNNNEVDLKT